MIKATFFGYNLRLDIDQYPPHEGDHTFDCMLCKKPYGGEMYLDNQWICGYCSGEVDYALLTQHSKSIHDFEENS